jgi:UDP-glucose 4-epimerase
MPERVFITGVAGFLGSHLADAFLSAGYEVTGIDNLIGGYMDNVPSGVVFTRGDCNDFPTIKRAMKGAQIVYHCAATAYEGLSVFSPHIVTTNIVTAATGAISAAIENRVRRFVTCSSMARYGTNQVPFREDMEPRPQDPYGIGKVAVEALLRNLATVHDMEWVIAVPHNIYGPRQKYDDPYRNVASIMCNMMLQGRQPYVYGDGSQQRCFSFVDDDIGPLVRMATSRECVGQVINIGPDTGIVTILELAQTIAGILDFPLEPVHTRGRPQEVHLAHCSADKARRLLGYEPKVALADGLSQMVEWIRERGVKPFTYHLPLEICNYRLPETWARRLM